MILVTGSTGTVGSQVVRALAAQGAPFRAMVRKPEDADRLRAQGIQTVIGDFSDAHSLDTALQGAERLFVVSPANPAQMEAEGGAIAAAQRAGIRHLVKLSVLAADPGSDCPFMRWGGEIEERIKGSGLPYTFLRPNGFMQNLLRDAPTIVAQSAFYAPAGDARVSFVDAADIGAVAARVLTEDGHAGQAYEITGPEAYSHEDIAEALSALLGKKVTYVAVSDDAARQGMAGSGMPEWLIDAVLALYRFYREGRGAVVTETVARLTGRPPRTLQEFLAENIQAFRG